MVAMGIHDDPATIHIDVKAIVDIWSQGIRYRIRQYSYWLNCTLLFHKAQKEVHSVTLPTKSIVFTLQKNVIWKFKHT